MNDIENLIRTHLEDSAATVGDDLVDELLDGIDLGKFPTEQAARDWARSVAERGRGQHPNRDRVVALNDPALITNLKRALAGETGHTDGGPDAA